MTISDPFEFVSPEFWELLEIACKDRTEFSLRMMKISREHLLQFIWTFGELAAEFKYEPYNKHFSPELSEDGIDDLAMWVIEQGRDYIYAVEKVPSIIPQHADLKYSSLGAAMDEYYRRYGEEAPYKDNYND